MCNTIFEVDHVYKSYHDCNVLEDISFKINQGDIIGYLGPNGAGKTTTIRLMLNLIKPESGQIHSNAQMIRAVLDKEGLYEQLTPLQHINYLYLLNFGRKSIKKEAYDFLNPFGLASCINKKVSEFSKGMKKRLSIACSLIGDPDLLILDEPFTGLDPQGQKAIEDLLVGLSSKTSIFLSSHNISIVSKVCNRVLMLNKQIVYDDFVLNKDFTKLEKIYFDRIGDNIHVNESI